jgi:hypothetical protein
MTSFDGRLLHQSERDDARAGGDGDELLVVERVRHGEAFQS